TFEDRDFGVHPHDGVMMAVGVNDCVDLPRWRLVALSFEEFGEDERLICEAAGIVIIGEEAEQLIAKRRDTTRFDAHERNAGTNCWTQRIEGLSPQSFRQIEHAEVLEGPTTTERS